MSTQIILKRINACTAIVLIALALAAAVMLFHQPTAKPATIEQQNKALEDLRQAQMNLTLAKLDSIRASQEEATVLASKTEANLSSKLAENMNALNKVRNEKVRDFTDYSSLQLQREVSALVRQYEAAKRPNSNTTANW